MRCSKTYKPKKTKKKLLTSVCMFLPITPLQPLLSDSWFSSWSCLRYPGQEICCVEKFAEPQPHTGRHTNPRWHLHDCCSWAHDKLTSSHSIPFFPSFTSKVCSAVHGVKLTKGILTVCPFRYSTACLKFTLEASMETFETLRQAKTWSHGSIHTQLNRHSWDERFTTHKY